jgi:small subunit ribosomal protein S2
MEPFIFQARNGVHIIDLQQTLANINQIHDMVRDEVSRGGIVLFVGTKRQAQDAIEQEAARCNAPYVNERWSSVLKHLRNWNVTAIMACLKN